jgi:serine protease inhibitor
MRNSRAAACVVAAATAVATVGCAAAQPGGHDTTLAQVVRGTAAHVPAASAGTLGAADTAFGLDLLGAWCRQAPAANLVFSPESLAAGLGLAYLGARGATATAMARVLHLPAAGPGTEADMHAQQAALAALNRPGVTLATSNRVWADPSLLPWRGYLDAVATGYGAGLSRVPLAADALYLNARWATPFEPSLTRPGPFTTAAGGGATVRFMHGSGYRFATAGGWTAVRLPYQGGQLAMTALLPPAGRAEGGCATPATPVLTALRAGLAAGAQAAAGVALPTVNLSIQQDMNSLLTGLGMGLAFSPAADFGGLSAQAGNISLVEHAATLQVAERGTVGSAATAVGIMPSDAVGLTGSEILFNRPYLLLVSGTRTGEPLFLARVADPAGK